MKKFLFIAGCARSGTSAFAQLLSGSKDVVMGMERFGHLESKENFSLTPGHFSKERFLRIEEGDTFYNNFEKYHSYDKLIDEKLDCCLYVGDKRPDLYEVYDDIFRNFPGATVFFIYRDIVEVASSYQGRAMEKKNWPANKDFRAAVKEWNRSLFLTREAIENGYNIKCVDYESVFINPRNINVIFETLGLNYGEDEREKLFNIMARSKQLQRERGSLLSEEEKKYVKDHAKMFLLDDMERNNILKC